MSSSQPPKTIEGVQALRAVAALMVVFHHARSSIPNAQSWPSFGEAGVDIFFVISGFVMAYTTRLLAGSTDLNARRIQAAEFLLRRVSRVVPLYWLALLWTARREFGGPEAGWGLVKDFLFVPRANTTYPDMLWPLMIQGWTLNYEMFFYLLFAISLLFARARTFLLIAALLALVAAGQAAGPLLSQAVEGWEAAKRFYSDSILLEFGLGVLLQKWTQAHGSPPWRREVFVALALVGFALLAVGHGSAPRALSEGLPALLIVWASIGAFAGLRLPFWERLADASYAIYLFHWAAFGAVKPVAAWLASVNVASWPVALIAIVLMALHVLVAVVAGLFIHRWIERPLVQFAQELLRLGKPRSSTAASSA